MYSCDCIDLWAQQKFLERTILIAQLVIILYIYESMYYDESYGLSDCVQA